MGSAQSRAGDAFKGEEVANANESLNNYSPQTLVTPETSPLDNLEAFNNIITTEDNQNSDEEVESYQGWLSTPAGSEPRASGDAHHPSSPMSNPSSNAASSTGWLGQRPSADTPLNLDGKDPRSSNNHDKQRFSTGTIGHARLSASSAGGESVATTISAGASARSSFALERASLEANRLSLEAFKGALGAAHAGQIASSSLSPDQDFSRLDDSEEVVTIDMLLKTAGLPYDMKDKFASLCVFPPQTPAPTDVLSLLWKTTSAEEITSSLNVLAVRGVVNVARLPTGHVWALPHVQYLQLLQTACKDTAATFHGRLVDAYLAKANPDAALPLATVPDDGYFLTNIGYHLIAAGRHEALFELLLSPAWLERKLLACGPGAVVADFRRSLLFKPHRNLKLILEAFQMSVGLVQRHPRVPGLLRTLIVGRLMATQLRSDMQDWMREQQAAIAADAALALAHHLPRPLPPLMPSLDQAGGLQRLALKGHRGAVSRVMLTPSGTEAVSGGADGTARVWDLEIGDCTLLLEGHTKPITDMDITADGSLLVTSSEDGTARAYELEKGQCLRVLAGHGDAITCLVMDPYGRFIITGSSDCTARVWDLASAQALHILGAPAGAFALALSPCTRFVLVGCADDTVRIYDVGSGQPMGTMTGHSRWVSAVAFTPDGKRAVSASHDGTVRVWSLRSGRCTALMEGHSGRINALKITPDGKAVVTGGDDSSVRIWDLKTGLCMKVLQGHASWVSDVALSPGGERLLSTSGDGTAIAWSLDSGEVIRVLEGHSGPVLAAALTRRARFAVTSAEDGSVRVWDFSATTNYTPKWHEGRIRALAAKDGIIVGTAGDDCVVRLWDSALGEFKGMLRGHAVPIRWAQFSQDGSRLITASPDRSVCVWDCTTLELVHELPVHKGSRVKSFAASGDLSICVICLFDSTVTVWDMSTQEPGTAIQKWGERDATRGHTSAVNEVLMTSDGSTVVTLSKDYTARVWDATTGNCLHVLEGHTDGVSGGCLSEESNLLATYSYDHTIKLWNLETGASVATIPLPTSVSKLCISDGGEKLAAALSNHTIILCDLEHDPKKAFKVIGGHTDEVTGLSFAKDGSVLSSCSLDGTVQVVDTASGAVQGIFVSATGLTSCHYDSVTQCIVAGTDRGVVHFIDASM